MPAWFKTLNPKPTPANVQRATKATASKTTSSLNKKELFSSRLARVNAQTPRHVKMKILRDIIKRTCKHFNIDPKELCDDPDSSAQSKSSSRENL